jgi:nicotinamide-nucleotide amidase
LLRLIYNVAMNLNPEQLTRELAEKLTQRESMICTAESCTGGLIAKTFTDLAGSSDWFDRGFVTYSNQAKMDMLGVSSETLLQQGAVSAETAREMAAGAIANSEAQYAIAVTGIAGPGGGSPEKPVGTVWFGFATPEHISCEKQVFEGDREQVRTSSLQYALQRVIQLLN